MLFIQNNELSDTREKFLALENAIDSVDQKFTELKQQSKSD
jgi:hypothetical protein